MSQSQLATVGRRIRQLRQEQGRSLREKARAIGISPASLSAIENGRAAPLTWPPDDPP